MSESRGMRLAKADEEDFSKTRSFLQCCENLFDNRWACSSDEQWQDWDDEDEDKKAILKLRKELAFYEDCEEEDIDNRVLLFEFIKHKYLGCDCHWGRVIMAADTLIQNVCDPSVDTVEFHPIFDDGMEDYIMGK